MNIYIETYGCTANKSDESIVKNLLLTNFFNISDDIENADIIIIITCTVINTTEQKMLSRLRYFKKLNKKIIVTGCMASIQSDLIKTILPHSKILPPYHIHKIIDVINKKNNIKYDLTDKTKYKKLFNDLTAPISISEGCDFSCSYCITTLARGNLRSFPPNEIKNDIQSALDQGCKEIQITSQDTSSYRFGSNIDLGILLNEISEIEGNFRIRVGMMNPYSALKKLNSIISGFDNDKIYKFLHLPIQSGDNTILKKMNRKYDVKDFLHIINSFKNKFPDITISTDIIVGFPSETNEQFYNSIKLLNKVKPDIVNITRFSSRPNTKAKLMSNRIKTEISKDRSRILSKISKEISYKNNKSYIGKILNGLVIEDGKNNTKLCRANNYKPIIIRDKIDLGEFIKIQIIDSTQNYLVGNII